MRVGLGFGVILYIVEYRETEICGRESQIQGHGVVIETRETARRLMLVEDLTVFGGVVRKAILHYHNNSDPRIASSRRSSVQPGMDLQPS